MIQIRLVHKILHICARMMILGEKINPYEELFNFLFRTKSLEGWWLVKDIKKKIKKRLLTNDRC
jgi:hypothetical protein